jgi:hypothetical protein
VAAIPKVAAKRCFYGKFSRPLNQQEFVAAIFSRTVKRRDSVGFLPVRDCAPPLVGFWIFFAENNPTLPISTRQGRILVIFLAHGKRVLAETKQGKLR